LSNAFGPTIPLNESVEKYFSMHAPLDLQIINPSRGHPHSSSRCSWKDNLGSNKLVQIPGSMISLCQFALPPSRCRCGEWKWVGVPFFFPYLGFIALKLRLVGRMLCFRRLGKFVVIAVTGYGSFNPTFSCLIPRSILFLHIPD
jgi:hypothetical protein